MNIFLRTHISSFTLYTSVSKGCKARVEDYKKWTIRSHQSVNDSGLELPPAKSFPRDQQGPRSNVSFVSEPPPVVVGSTLAVPCPGNQTTTAFARIRWSVYEWKRYISDLIVWTSHIPTKIAYCLFLSLVPIIKQSYHRKKYKSISLASVMALGILLDRYVISLCKKHFPTSFALLV